MAEVKVADIAVGALDAAGARIVAVYGKVGSLYAVYRNDDQVMVQFADDSDQGANQRTALSPLASVRAQVSAQIAKLRTENKDYQTGKADQYDRRLAGVLLVALQGNPTGAETDAKAIAADLAEDAASDIRTFHLLYATLATAVAIIVSRLLSTDWFQQLFARFDDAVVPNYWTASAVGAIGSLFSISIAIRARQVRVDLKPWDNAVDAVLRIFVGAVSGTLLVAMLMGSMVELKIGSMKLGFLTHGLVVAAFLAGFTERLVADFLGGFVLGKPAAAAAAAPAAAPAAKDERAIAAGAAVAPPPPPPPSPDAAQTPPSP
jgi:uncharacterized integral membrane protein